MITYMLVLLILLALGSLLLFLHYRRAGTTCELERHLSSSVVDDAAQQFGNQGLFVRYWATKLRLSMNCPRSYSEANRLVASNRLDAMWREELPSLRMSNRAYYQPRVIAMAFIPSQDELIAEQSVMCGKAVAMRDALSKGGF